MFTRLALLLGLAAAAVSCGWPETRMVPVADYGAAEHASYSAQPARTAGPTQVLTTSPDGATLFVCGDGTTRRGSSVPPGAAPAC